MADMDQVLAELKRIRELLEGSSGCRYVVKDMLPLAHMGEAVVPKAWTPSCSLRSITSTRLALCLKVSAQTPDLVYDRTTGTMAPRPSTAPDLVNEVRELRAEISALLALPRGGSLLPADRPAVEPAAQGVNSSPLPTQPAPLSPPQDRNPGAVA